MRSVRGRWVVIPLLALATATTTTRAECAWVLWEDVGAKT